MAWPWNQPGCTAMAPPWTGQRVRFVVVRIPPPRWGVNQAIVVVKGVYGREGGRRERLRVRWENGRMNG